VEFRPLDARSKFPAGIREILSERESLPGRRRRRRKELLLLLPVKTKHLTAKMV